MRTDEMRDLLQLVQFDDYAFHITEAGEGNIYLQPSYVDADIVTGKMEVQHTRKWKLSPHMTKSELVQTAFKLCMTSMEHRCRESFLYQGRRVFGPHFDIDRLWEFCGSGDAHDYRKDLQQEVAR